MEKRKASVKETGEDVSQEKWSRFEEAVGVTEKPGSQNRPTEKSAGPRKPDKRKP